MAEPPAGPDAGRLLGDLVRAETRLYNAVDDRVRREAGTGLGRHEILEYLGRHAQRRVHDVANEFAITVGAASKAIDRMVDAGLCVRTANPADGRSSFLVLTDSGRRLVEETAPLVRDEASERLRAALTPQDLDTLARVLATLRASLEIDPTTGGVGRQVR